MQLSLKSSVLLVAMGLAAGALSAQTPQPAPPPATAPAHQPNPDRETKRLAKELGLTADQKSQIEPILADRQQRIATLESNTALDPKSLHKQRRAIMADTEQKLNAVLTPAQQQQWASIKAEHQHKGQPAPATAPPA